MGDVVSPTGAEPEASEAQDELPGLSDRPFEDDVKAFTLALLLHRPELGTPRNANLLADIIAAFRDFDAQKAGLLAADTGDHGELSDDSFHLSSEA